MSTMTDVHYHFEGDTVYAIHEGRVIASGKTDKMDEVESDATNYLKGLKNEKDEKKRKSATHVITPNGIKGTVLQRTASVWQDEVTVRLENGEVKTFAAHGVKDWMTEKTASSNPVEGLDQRLGSTYNHDRASLVQRHRDLVEIYHEAKRLITSGVSYADQQKLDSIIVTAEAEGERIHDAVNAIDEGQIEAYQPPTPMPVEQASMGRSDDWLDAVVQDMNAEFEDVDYEQVLNDDPTLLAAGLDDGIVADQGASREIALSHVVNKTAGFTGADVDNYRDQFLARFEAARRRELSTRTANTRKEAAVATSHVEDAPDEALFG
jgi:uncharacterized protein YciI